MMPTQQAKIELRAKLLFDGPNHTDIYHSYIVMTLSHGEAYILRGGPNTALKDTPFALHVIGAEEKVPYTYNTRTLHKDWDQDGTHVTQQIASGTDTEMLALFGNMQKEAIAINHEKRSYHLTRNNCNTATHRMIKATHLEVILPKTQGQEIILAGTPDKPLGEYVKATMGEGWEIVTSEIIDPLEKKLEQHIIDPSQRFFAAHFPSQSSLSAPKVATSFINRDANTSSVSSPIPNQAPFSPSPFSLAEKANLTSTQAPEISFLSTDSLGEVTIDANHPLSLLSSIQPMAPLVPNESLLPFFNDNFNAQSSLNPSVFRRFIEEVRQIKMEVVTQTALSSEQKEALLKERLKHLPLPEGIQIQPSSDSITPSFLERASQPLTVHQDHLSMYSSFANANPVTSFSSPSLKEITLE